MPNFLSPRPVMPPRPAVTGFRPQVPAYPGGSPGGPGVSTQTSTMPGQGPAMNGQAPVGNGTGMFAPRPQQAGPGPTSPLAGLLKARFGRLPGGI